MGTSVETRYNELVTKSIHDGNFGLEALEYANDKIKKEVKEKAFSSMRYPAHEYERIRELRNQLVQERGIDVNDQISKTIFERNLAWGDAIDLFKKEKGNDNTAA